MHFLHSHHNIAGRHAILATYFYCLRLQNLYLYAHFGYLILKENALVLTGVYLKACDVNLKKSIPSISLYPCHFKMLGNAFKKNGVEGPSHKNNNGTRTMSGYFVETEDWLIHDEVVAALSDKIPNAVDQEATNKSESQKGVENLIQSWYYAQLGAITSITGMEVSSLVIGSETLLHFCVSCFKHGTHGKIKLLSNSSEDKHEVDEVLFVLAIDDECLQHGKLNAYEVSLGERNKKNGNEADLVLFKMMKLGDPVLRHSIEMRSYENQISSDVSSLGWMEATADDVINSRYFLGGVLVPPSFYCFHQFDN